jgi:hypothetical protein
MDAPRGEMNHTNQVFRRPAGEGWLVLAGILPSLGGETPRLAECLLDHVDLSRNPVCIVSRAIIEREDAAPFIEELEALLDVAVEVINVTRINSADLAEVLTSAGLVVLMGGPVEHWLELFHTALSGHKPTYFLGEGTLLLAAGAAAAALGSWIFLSERQELEPALGWLEGAIILPQVLDPLELPGMQEMLSQKKRVYALGLPKGAILAMGPEGEIEVWGETQPVVVLSMGWLDRDR